MVTIGYPSHRERSEETNGGEILTIGRDMKVKYLSAARAAEYRSFTVEHAGLAVGEHTTDVRADHICVAVAQPR
jgi:hypothetical protein